MGPSQGSLISSDSETKVHQNRRPKRTLVSFGMKIVRIDVIPNLEKGQELLSHESFTKKPSNVNLFFISFTFVPFPVRL